MVSLLSNYIEKYKNRLKRVGNNVGEAYQTSTDNFVQNHFADSTTFRKLRVESYEFPTIKEIDSRVIELERMGTLREVLFRPHEGLNLGTIVEFDNETWLMSDKWGSNEAGNFKALVQKCNRTLKWRTSSGVIREVDCIASANPLGSKANQSKNDIEWNKYDVSLPTGQLFVYTEFNPYTKQIEMNQRFIFGANVYEVVGIDDTSAVDKYGYGILQMTVKITTKRSDDDFVTRIASNTAYSMGEKNNDEEQEGSLW